MTPSASAGVGTDGSHGSTQPYDEISSGVTSGNAMHDRP